jgi:hypothetical protein
MSSPCFRVGLSGGLPFALRKALLLCCSLAMLLCCSACVNVKYFVGTRSLLSQFDCIEILCLAEFANVLDF